MNANANANACETRPVALRGGFAAVMSPLVGSGGESTAGGCPASAMSLSRLGDEFLRSSTLPASMSPTQMRALSQHHKLATRKQCSSEACWP